jgi:hypothetical protein
VGFKKGLQGTTIRGEGPRVKLCVSELFECKTHNKEEAMMGQSRGQFVYRGTPSIVFRPQNNGSTIVSPSVWEPTIKKVA